MPRGKATPAPEPRADADRRAEAWLYALLTVGERATGTAGEQKPTSKDSVVQEEQVSERGRR